MRISDAASERISELEIPVEAVVSEAVWVMAMVCACTVLADGRWRVARMGGMRRAESAAMVSVILSHRHADSVWSESVNRRCREDVVAIETVSDVTDEAEELCVVRHDCA